MKQVIKKVIKKIILLNKKEGETPLEVLAIFRSKNKEYKDVPMTYAGRLDPMASGLLVILAGEECKNKEKYLALSKEYEFEVLFGFATDTYDILGKITKTHMSDMWGIGGLYLEKKIQENLKYFNGKFIQKYPIYSSKTVKGKPLFQYSREGVEVKIPEREVNVKSLNFIKLKKINKEKLLENIIKRVNKVSGPAPHSLSGVGDFRQEEILKIWKKQLKEEKKESKAFFFLASFKIKCSSGTYVRGIADSMGNKIGIPALAYSIKRTKVGKYTII